VLGVPDIDWVTLNEARTIAKWKGQAPPLRNQKTGLKTATALRCRRCKAEVRRYMSSTGLQNEARVLVETSGAPECEAADEEED
jgi:hypothetical protein